MNEELKDICKNYDFDGNFQELLKGIECTYNLIVEQEEKDENSISMVNWIIKNTKVDELKCLSEKEKFLFGGGRHFI